MNFVDEQENVAALLHFLHDVLQPLFKLAPVLTAGNHAAHVQGQYPLADQHFRNAALHDSLGEPFYHGAFAYAGLANQHRIVLRAADQDLNDALNFRVSANDGIQLVIPGGSGQITAVLSKHGRFGFFALDLGIWMLFRFFSAAAAFRTKLTDNFIPGLFRVHLQLL